MDSKFSIFDNRGSNVMHSLANTGKARQRLGYEPMHRLRDDLMETVA